MQKNMPPAQTMHFSLTDLRIFRAVADTGSFSLCAEAMNLSIPAVSGRIKNLETAFAVTLLDRSNQGISLTPPGRRLLEHAIELLEKAALLDEDMLGYAQGLKGRISIVANTTAITEFLPQKLAVFLQNYPQIEISLAEYTRGEVVQRVREGRAEIGIFNHCVLANGLDVFPFAKDRLTLIVHENHAWVRHTAMSFADTLISQHVCLSATTPQYNFLRQKAQEMGFRLKNRIHVPSFDAMATLVANNVGVAVLPHSAAVRFSQHLSIKLIPLLDAWADNDLSLCVRALSELPERTQQLVKALIAH